MLYVFFWVIPRRLNFICRRFRTLCPFHLHRQVGVEFYTYLPMKMEQTGCSETSAYKIQMPGNYPEERCRILRLPAYEDGTDSVPKRRHIKFRSRGITQKKGVEFCAYLPMKMEQSIPKRRHIKFRLRGITQKKTYKIMSALAMTKKGEVDWANKVKPHGLSQAIIPWRSSPKYQIWTEIV